METEQQREDRLAREAQDPQNKDKQIPGRDVKQSSGSKRLTVMVLEANKGKIPHVIEVQPGSTAADVLAQVGATGKYLSKAETGGPSFKLTDTVFDSVGDQDTVYVR